MPPSARKDLRESFIPSLASATFLVKSYHSMQKKMDEIVADC